MDEKRILVALTRAEIEYLKSLLQMNPTDVNISLTSTLSSTSEDLIDEAIIIRKFEGIVQFGSDVYESVEERAEEMVGTARKHLKKCSSDYQAVKEYLYHVHKWDEELICTICGADGNL